MKKKILVIAVILCIVSVSQIHAFGLGAQVNFYAENDYFAPGLSVCVSPSRTFNIAANWLIRTSIEQYTILGFTFDAVPLSVPIFRSAPTLIASPKAWSLNFTLGLGVFTNFWFKEIQFDDNFMSNGGLRVPIGLSFFFGQNFEAFLHVAPSWNIQLVPSVDFQNLCYPIAIGARIWFK